MKSHKNRISICAWILSAALLSACNVTPDAMLGRDRAADDATTSLNQSQPCDSMYSSVKDGTGECATPYLPGTVLTTKGDDGDLEIYFKQLSDGNYPLIQSLKYSATEYVQVGGSTVQSTYDVVFACTAETDTSQHLRPFHCVAQGAPRLRSTVQVDSGIVKFSEVVVENPSCHSTVTYTATASYCYPGESTLVPFKPPVLGLVKP